jgi:hypothetical protein
MAKVWVSSRTGGPEVLVSADIEQLEASAREAWAEQGVIKLQRGGFPDAAKASSSPGKKGGAGGVTIGP